jgi:cell division protein FtsL
MTRPEKISKMKGSRNTGSGVRIKNARAKKGFRMTGKQFFLVAIMLFVLMGSCIGHVWSNFEMTQKGYTISQLKNEEMRLIDINRKLKIEMATLKSPQSLETQARKLGLNQPSPGQIVVVK